MGNLQFFTRLCNRTLLLVSATLFCASCCPAFGAGADIQTFVLKEEIGQSWNHDLVFFPLDHPLGAAEQTGATLLGPDGMNVPYQVETVGAESKIGFLADLPTYGQRAYRLVREKPKASASTFQIERNGDSLRVSNGITGVEVPTPAGHYQDGPILGIRMKSGAWIGGSQLTTKRTILSYGSQITAEGPVFIDIDCRYRFAQGKQWGLQLRLIAGEPVVLIRESFDLSDDSMWEFVAGRRFAPNHAIMLAGEDTKYTVFPLDNRENNVQLQLCPWVTWWDRRDGTFFGMFHAPDGAAIARDDKLNRLAMTPPPDPAASGDDMLIAAAGDVASWARSGPEIYDYGPGKFVPVKAAKDGELAFQLQLAAPGRFWLLGTGSVGDNLVADGQVAPVQKLMNRYCETPLDRVKDMPLHWRHTAAYPRLVVKADDIKRMVALPDFQSLLDKNPRTRDMKKILLPMIAASPEIAAQLAAKNQVQIDAIKGDIMAKLDAMVAYFRYGNNHRGSAMFGTIIPRVDIGYVLPPADLALGAGIFSPQEQERLYAQLAFVADKMASPDYESPGRSLTGNPNMVTAWAASQALMACMLPDHPHAQAWYKEGMGRVDSILDKWQGPEGAWLEAPHYQMASMDPIFLAKIAAANSGYAGGKLDERLMRAILFLAKISTPPDPRFDNRRHFPPLGNTYLMESSLIFGATAKLYRQEYPEQSAALQWMWRQQGKPHWIAIGGALMLDFYIELLADEDWNPAAPPWTSEALPGFGAVLHSGWPGDRETYMVYHQGDVATAHYDHDQGSFEMWGKGRPLCLDWGYNGYAPAWEHNRLDIGDAGKVVEFAGAAAADYVHGKQTGGWDRQILFVKDADPLGPTYFVLRDSTVGTGAANWWLWVNTRKDGAKQSVPSNPDSKAAVDMPAQPAQNPVQIVDGVVRSAGEGDVDLDVWFAPPTKERLDGLEIKDLTIATVTGYPNGSWSSWTEGKTTQQGLHLAQPLGQPLVSVLYPRLHEQRTPRFVSLADGKAIKVTSEQGDDYVFLSLEPFDFQDGPVSFSGTAGVMQHRGDRVTLTLSAAGSIGFGTASLKADAPQSKTFTVR